MRVDGGRRARRWNGVKSCKVFVEGEVVVDKREI